MWDVEAAADVEMVLLEVDAKEVAQNAEVSTVYAPHTIALAAAFAEAESFLRAFLQADSDFPHCHFCQYRVSPSNIQYVYSPPSQ